MNIAPRFQIPSDSGDSEWPLVAINDDGIRPAGDPDACFYCKSKVGKPHATDCVCIRKRVAVSYVVEIEIDVPHSWTADEIVESEDTGGWQFNIAENGSAEIQHVSASYVQT